MELYTRTLEVKEVIHCLSVIWIWMTSSMAMMEGIGKVEHEEIQRAKEMGVKESVDC